MRNAATASIDAEVSAYAYARRRQMREWLADGWPSGPRATIEKVKELTQKDPLDRAEEWSRKIVTAARGASPEVAAPTRTQYVLFYRAPVLLRRASVAHQEGGSYNAKAGKVEGERWWLAVVEESGGDEIRRLVEQCIDALTGPMSRSLGMSKPSSLRPVQFARTVRATAAAR